MHFKSSGSALYKYLERFFFGKKKSGQCRGLQALSASLISDDKCGNIQSAVPHLGLNICLSNQLSILGGTKSAQLSYYALVGSRTL